MSSLPNSTATLEQLLPVDSAILRGYAQGVADELSRGPLTLDRRDRLLKRAQHLGMSRFEAAMVVAVVERRPAAVPPSIRTVSKPIIQHAQRSPLFSTLAAAAVVQAVIVAAVWWIAF